MISRLTQFLFFVAVLTGMSLVANAQPPDLPDATTSRPRGRRADLPFGMKEMLAKQRLERQKKEYQEMLDRGDEALRLTSQLEHSYAQNNGFSQADRARLESLEKLVTKIRKELGGDDDERDEDAMLGDNATTPSTMEEAFTYLKTTTVKLVDELKKTTRFSISAVAIQTSNTVIKLVRFLRGKK
jgi:hypothetical protein